MYAQTPRALDDRIFNKCHKSHESYKAVISFENSGCSLISNHASAQSNLG